MSRACVLVASLCLVGSLRPLVASLCASLGLLVGCGGEEPAEPVRMASLPLDLTAVDYASILEHRALYGGPTASFPLTHYGFVSPETPDNPSKTNHQPTFWAPLGTPVLAPVTGTVRQVAVLYSGDQGVHIDGDAGEIWEAEHILNVSVAVGDRVTAGQPIGTVSDYECEYANREFGNDTHCGTGVGIVELGLLFGGEAPSHGCPFTDAHLDPAARDAMFAELAAARAEIETLLGEPDFFDEATWAAENCITLDDIAD